MPISPTKYSESNKKCHHESGIVNLWWVINNSATKTLSRLFLIHRSCSGIIIKLWRNNINCQSVKTVLNLTNRLSSALSGVSTNKALHLTQQYAVSLRYTLYRGSNELER
jgi:hypothetical protein